MYSDLTRFDILKGHLNNFSMILRYRLDFLLLLRKRYTNYLSIGYSLKKKKFPIYATLRDGTSRKYVSMEEIWFECHNIAYDIDTDVIIIEDMKFKGGTRNGDIVSIFVNNDYKLLPLKDRIVVDIGANIADSSIYFVKRGAKKVYAIEPNQTLYNLATENIGLNSMTDRVEVVFAACSSNTSRESSPPFLSLAQILEDYNIVPDFLKVDCEGCEYDIILNSSEKTLWSFDYIIVEYHYGYQMIKKKLEKCGFRTRVSGPTYYPQGDEPNNLTTRFSNLLSSPKTNSLVEPFIGYVFASKSGF